MKPWAVLSVVALVVVALIVGCALFQPEPAPAGSPPGTPARSPAQRVGDGIADVTKNTPAAPLGEGIRLAIDAAALIVGYVSGRKHEKRRVKRKTKAAGT